MIRHFCTGTPAAATSFFDVVIVGGGLVGSAMACSIGKSTRLGRKRVLLLDSAKTPSAGRQSDEFYSNRVSAVAPSSVNLFRKFGIWETISQRAQPISSLNVEDGCSGTQISFEQLSARSPIAHIVENERIVRTLHQCIEEACPNVDCRQGSSYRELSIPEDLSENVKMELDGGQSVEASLLIAADGAQSRVRSMSGIDWEQEDYRQMAIVATLELSTPQGSPNTAAWQRFMPAGPVALLPLSERLSSLVWTTSTEEANRLLLLSREEFVQELNTALTSQFAQNSLLNGPLDSFASLLNSLPPLRRPSPTKFVFPSVLSIAQQAGGEEDSRLAFPLSSGHAQDYIGHRLALIGDAAHRIHPLAGQGVNLGWSDVSNLTAALEMAVEEGGDLGSLTYLKAYDDRSQRRNVPISVCIDSLNRLFSTDSSPSVLIRSLGFTLLDRLMPAKDLIVRMAS